DAQTGPLMRRQRGDVAAPEPNGAAVDGQGTGDAVDQRRLARAVGSDETDALPRLHGQAHLVQRGEAAEALDQSLHLQQRLGHGQCPRSRRTRPRMPSGARTTKATSTTPTMKRFISEEMVTVASCEAVPSRTAPITGPTQLVVPPIICIASAFTA